MSDDIRHVEITEPCKCQELPKLQG
jgi:hypothetical protein